MSRMLLGDRLHSVSPNMERMIPMDDPAYIPELLDIAQSVDLTDTIQWVKEHFYNNQDIENLKSQEQRDRETSEKAKEKRRQRCLAENGNDEQYCDMSAWYNAPLNPSLIPQDSNH